MIVMPAERKIYDDEGNRIYEPKLQQLNIFSISVL